MYLSILPSPCWKYCSKMFFLGPPSTPFSTKVPPFFLLQGISSFSFDAGLPSYLLDFSPRCTNLACFVPPSGVPFPPASQVGRRPPSSGSCVIPIPFLMFVCALSRSSPPPPEERHDINDGEIFIFLPQFKPCF